MMFTDWSNADPKYFYMRGAIYGFILATMIWVVIVPKITEYYHNRKD